MLTNKQLKVALGALPAERITPEYMKNRISEVKFHKLGETLTHCTLQLDNKYSVTGESACVAPENYNQEIGEKIAYENAFQKLWPLFGFLLAEKRHQFAQGAPV